MALDHSEEPAGHIRQGRKERTTAPGSDQGERRDYREDLQRHFSFLQLLGLHEVSSVFVFTGHSPNCSKSDPSSEAGGDDSQITVPTLNG